MKRCPECRRDYYDDTLSFCLEDGSPLVYGVSEDDPATAILNEFGVLPSDGSHSDSATRSFAHTTASEGEPRDSLGSSTERQSLFAPRATERHQRYGASSEKQSFSSHRAAEAKEKSAINKILLGTIVLGVIALGGFFGYRYFKPAAPEQIS